MRFVVEQVEGALLSVTPSDLTVFRCGRRKPQTLITRFQVRPAVDLNDALTLRASYMLGNNRNVRVLVSDGSTTPIHNASPPFEVAKKGATVMHELTLCFTDAVVPEGVKGVSLLLFLSEDGLPGPTDSRNAALVSQKFNVSFA